ncbi:MAG TPA: hypothetical protein VKR32_14325, partial [Puia sp.]|nr:hypothetical protein [Puia sp.]
MLSRRRSLILCSLGLHFLMTSLPFGVYPQCTPPGGSIALTNSFNSGTIATGSTYYVPTSTIVQLDYSSAGALTINGTVIIEAGAVLYIKMGNNNMTINGTIQVCTSAIFEIDTAHDLTMNNNSALINIGYDGTVEFCHFGHDFNPSNGTIAMNDFAVFEMIDYHSFNNADNDIFTYTGSGTVGKGTGNPIVHFGFSGAAGYSDQNTAA